MANGFQGKDGQKIPEMTPEVVKGISERYIELYENIVGENLNERCKQCIEASGGNINGFLLR